MSDEKKSANYSSAQFIDLPTTIQRATALGRRFPYNLWIFKTPRGFFRVMDVMLSIVAFGCIADVTGISQFTSFQYELGAGILATLYGLLVCTYYLFPGFFEKKFGYLGSTELLCDLVFFCIVISAGVAATYQCGANYSVDGLNTHETTCYVQTGHNIEASCTFMLLNAISFANSIYWSYRNLMDEPKRLFA